MILSHENKWRKIFGWSMMFGGIAGTLASFMLLMDKFRFLESGTSPSCSINAFVDCGKVFNSPYASFFGFPNVIIGLIFFPLAFFLGFLLLKNVKIPANIYNTGKPFIYGAIAFCFVFVYTTSYLIGALCLWCSLAWIATFLVAFPYLEWAKFLNSKTPSDEEKVVQSWQKHKMLIWFVILLVFFFGNVSLAYWANGAGYWDNLPHFDPFFWLKK